MGTRADAAELPGTAALALRSVAAGAVGVWVLLAADGAAMAAAAVVSTTGKSGGTSGDRGRGGRVIGVSVTAWTPGGSGRVDGAGAKNKAAANAAQTATAASRVSTNVRREMPPGPIFAGQADEMSMALQMNQPDMSGTLNFCQTP